MTSDQIKNEFAARHSIKHPGTPVIYHNLMHQLELELARTYAKLCGTGHRENLWNRLEQELASTLVVWTEIFAPRDQTPKVASKRLRGLSQLEVSGEPKIRCADPPERESLEVDGGG